MFPLPSLTFWWLRLNIIKMMDYELNLDGWLEDVSLFPNEPSNYSFSLDFPLQSGKTSNEAVQIADFNDLPWYDEKVDFSLLEDPKSLQISDTDLNEILSIIGSNSDSSYLSSDVQNSNYFDAFNNELNDLQSQVASPENSDFSLSPGYETPFEVGSPPEFVYSPEYEPISEANSPAEYVSDATADSPLSNELNSSPGSISSTSSADGSCQDSMPAVFVTVCNDASQSFADQVSEALSIEEVSKSVRNRKFVNNGNEIPKVQVSLLGKDNPKASLRNTFHPYSKATSKRGTSKVERKKVQNKEAAARYRIKKRIEEKELSDVVSGLEAEQSKLKSKHDDLETEIKYLKKLMREMLQKKGIL